MLLVRVEDETSGRVWWELRQDDEQLLLLGNSIAENHPDGNHVVMAWDCERLVELASEKHECRFVYQGRLEPCCDAASG